ncbi:MAG TPA: thioredoxin family protein [Gammaproteobacteria bacterium]|nr:thioredoxin family protein [Gammaproteobacteria bacterium]HRP86559.1 thioredoxin family protein [Gammaproteobacteria bacterium]
MKHIQILGSGCSRCQVLADNAEAAAKSLGLEYTLEKITDVNRIAEFGIMLTPALVVEGEVKTFGRVLSPENIRPLLEG